MRACLPVVLALCALPLAGTAAAADAARGRALYEAHCGACHGESVHGRPHREARDFDAVRGWVRRWSMNLGLAWTDAEIDDVAAHLNERFYRFPCPSRACSATGSRAAAPKRLALDGGGALRVP
jgi:mono/diheme cytochrome c family protein